MVEKVYFNGINGKTGRYGLPPMSVTALADHILRDRIKLLKRLQNIELELNNKITNENKIVIIVDLLMRIVISLIDKNMPQEALLEGLAAKLMGILLEQNDILPGDIQEFATILKAQPMHTIAFIVEQLGRGAYGGTELARLLTSVERDNTQSIRNLVRQQFGRALDQLQNTHLHIPAAKALDGDGTLKTSWLENFVRDLNLLPMATMRIITDRDTARVALQQLSTPLKRYRETISPQVYFVDALIQELENALTKTGLIYWQRAVLLIKNHLLEWHHHDITINWSAFSKTFQDWTEAMGSSLAGDMGVVPWIDPRNINKTGWGLIFPTSMPSTQVDAIKEAIAPLLIQRERQAGKLFRIYEGKDGYRPGDKPATFLMRPPLRTARPEDPVDPENTGVPYYLLLVGNPTQIPFDFQYQLDVQYAVGRLDFGDDIQAYANYAENVVASERDPSSSTPKAIFAGVANPRDKATELSHKYLVNPLFDYFTSITNGSKWIVHKLDPAQTMKSSLLTAIQDIHPPKLFFIASHGMEYDRDDAQQRSYQGALLCQNWQGEQNNIPKDYFLSADDITSKVNLTGSINFLFACYSAGTPQTDNFYRMTFKETGQPIAKEPFIATLPQAMLRLRNRGALAVIGHVERVWGSSFLAPTQIAHSSSDTDYIKQTSVFESTLSLLLEGHPVGSALDCFNMRYAALSTELTNLYHEIGDQPTTQQAYALAERWTANNDARGYIILGDPAVRLCNVPI